MQISAIKKGDLVQIDHRGEQLIAEVAEPAHQDATGRRVISLTPDPPRGIAKPMRLTATARQVIGHWAKRGRSRSKEA